jgi:hypothetical protein
MEQNKPKKKGRPSAGGSHMSEGLGKGKTEASLPRKFCEAFFLQQFMWT